MYVKIGETPNAQNYRTIDLNTNKEIENCFAADDETGEYWVFDTDENGKIYAKPNEKGEMDVVRVKKVGNIKLILANEI